MVFWSNGTIINISVISVDSIPTQENNTFSLTKVVKNQSAALNSASKQVLFR